MAGRPCPKTPAFRCQKLRDLAEEAPHCMRRACRVVNVGQVVGCHRGGLAHGRGMGHKTHDLVAYLCGDCHNLIDRRTGNLTPEEADQEFLDAYYESNLWLLESGHLEVA
jgi:hypothetical protein